MADGESTGERLDRELMELLQGLRVVLPGVQVLLAFLLTVPFQQRFAELPGSLRNTFFASIACATVATALLIAPSANHRMRWRARDKERPGAQRQPDGPVGHRVPRRGHRAGPVCRHQHPLRGQLALLVTGVAVVVFGWVWCGLRTIGRSSADDADRGGS